MFCNVMRIFFSRAAFPGILGECRHCKHPPPERSAPRRWNVVQSEFQEKNLRREGLRKW